MLWSKAEACPQVCLTAGGKDKAGTSNSIYVTVDPYNMACWITGGISKSSTKCCELKKGNGSCVNLDSDPGYANQSPSGMDRFQYQMGGPDDTLQLSSATIKDRNAAGEDFGTTYLGPQNAGQDKNRKCSGTSKRVYYEGNVSAGGTDTYDCIKIKKNEKPLSKGLTLLLLQQKVAVMKKNNL